MSRQGISSELPNEQVMKENYSGSTAEILSNEERFIKNDNSIKCGLEIEYGLINEENEPVEETDRDFICKNTDFTDIELGAAQLELRTDPIDL